MKILHLYHDIMNLYGEYANVSALERMLEKSGVKFTTDRLTLFDNADLGDYDFIYIGSGTEKNQKLVLQDFKKNKDFLVEYINILTKPIVGFVNKCSEIKGIENHLFTVKHGLGDYENAKAEGLKDKNLFATHVTGPIMIKNPHFLEYIALQISKNTDSFKPCTDYLDYERAGYEITLGELTKRFEE